jgi:CBS domain-containing protein
MVTRPETHSAHTTVAELRRFFRDDHVHLALIVEEGRLVSSLERGDLAPELADSALAWRAGTLESRTIRPEAALVQALGEMRLTGRRRLAVTDKQGMLLGLLCLKASGTGFCSDHDVATRRSAARRFPSTAA